MSKRALILGGVGLAGLAAAAFFLMEPDPQVLLRKAQRKLAVEKTMRLEVDAALALPPEDLGGVVVPSATSVDIVMRVDLDRTDPVKHASATVFDFTQGVAPDQRKLSGEARRKDGRHYLKLEETGDLPADIASSLKGKWVVSDHPFIQSVFPPDERSLDERPLDAAGWVAMRDAFVSVDAFTVTAKKPVEKLGNAKARRYAVEMNMEAASALMLKLRELRTGTSVTAEDVLAVTAQIVRWGKPVGDVWIDKRTGKFLKIGLITSVEVDESSGAAGGTLAFSRYGQPVAVDAPPAEEIEKVLGPQFVRRLSMSGDRGTETVQETPLSKLPDAPGTAIQEKNDSDGDGLADGQEFFYGSDAWNPDTDGDGWSDAHELDRGMNPIGPGALFGFGL